jgi:hypothetical protein
MTVPFLTQAELLDLLKKHGWIEVSNNDWETHNRIMIGNGKDSFPLQLQSVYFFNHVVKLCDSIEIPAPDDHRLCYNQLKEFKTRESKKKEDPDKE